MSERALHYLDEGKGSETIIFAHGLLYDTSMWSQQISHFKGRYRCIAYDSRGHGQSPVTEDGYDMDTLTDDAIALIERLDVGPCHFVGLSMGGFVGLRIALRRPDLLKSMTLLDTSAEIEPSPRVFALLAGNNLARWTGFGPFLRWMMAGMFGREFMRDPQNKKLREFIAKRLRANDRIAVYKATRAVLRREGVLEQLRNIDLPTLIMFGNEDIVTARTKSENMHTAISNSDFRIIKGSGHMSAIEKPDDVNEAIGALIDRNH